MSKPHESAISRLVAHHGGASALSAKMGGRPPYQRIQEWVARGWASPSYIFALKPLLIDGMELDELAEDRERAKAAA